MNKEILNKIVTGESLNEEEAYETMNEIMLGITTPAQIASFLTALRVKGETVEEITGCARAMRENAVSLKETYPLAVDTCGTGGDTKGTFNISTVAAFVVAGTGIMVAKHVAQFFRKSPVDELPYSRDYECRRWLKNYFYELKWYEVYDFIEFFVDIRISKSA